MDRQHFALALALIFLITGGLYYFSTTGGMRHRWPRIAFEIARPSLPRYSMAGGLALQRPPGDWTAGLAGRRAGIVDLLKNHSP